MARIFKSFMLIIAIATFSGGATWSYFNDTATISGNTFSAGTLAIEAGGQDCQQNHYGWYENGQNNWHEDKNCNKKHHNCQHRSENCTAETKFEVKNAQPGNCETKEFAIKNTGTLTAKDFTADLIKEADPLCDALEISPENLSAVTISPNDSQNVSVQICFTDDGTDQSDLQGRTCSFTLNINAKAFDGENTLPEPIPNN